MDLFTLWFLTNFFCTNMNFDKPVRAFALLYGWSGLQLSPILLCQRLSLLSILHNICVILVYIYMQLHYCHDESRVLLTHKKPLTGMTINAEYLLFPLAYTFSMLYFLVKGQQILKLLNSQCFVKTASVKQVKIIAFFDNVSFLYPFLKIVPRLKFQHLTLLTVFCKVQTFVFFYVVHIIPTIIWRLVQFYKLSSYQSLVQIEGHLLKKEYSTVMQSVKQLASVNEQLDDLMSPVLLLLLINYSFNIVSTLCVILSNFTTIYAFSYISFLVANLLYIIWLVNQCCQSLNRISQHFREAENRVPVNCSPSYAFLRHIDIYGHYFKYQFFSMFTIDGHFFLTAFALFVNMAVILTQTQ